MNKQALYSNKAQSVQVGFIITLGIIILFASLMQVNQVPVEEQQVEAEHREDIHDSLTSIAQDYANANQINHKHHKNLPLGSTYEGGFIFGTPIPKQNSLDPQGTIQSSVFGNSVNIENTEPIASEETKDSWELPSLNVYTSNSYLEYTVNYQHIDDNFKYVYENGLLYLKGYYDNNQTEGAYGVINDQNIIRGNTINLPIMESRFQQTGISETKLMADPVSTGGSPMQITDDENNDIILEIPTKLPVEEWRSMLSNVEAIENPNTDVERQDGNPRNDDEIIEEYVLEITLQGYEVYNLQVSKIHVSTSTDRNIQTQRLPPIYVDYSYENGVTGDNPISIKGNVRDRYHNPVDTSGTFTAEAIDIETGNSVSEGQFSSGSGDPDGTTVHFNSDGYFRTSFYSQDNNAVRINIDNPSY